ncbi:hypothetical protein BJX68DRAFT_272715 [Aspergillus pseudodeflectus]|uniref:Uncharacterized protein n=1 Tax=Aspergillus pseudodeflectus TaxID=176178 RepID=A0ABR4JDW0_9EURO
MDSTTSTDTQRNESVPVTNLLVDFLGEAPFAQSLIELSSYRDIASLMCTGRIIYQVLSKYIGVISHGAISQPQIAAQGENRFASYTINQWDPSFSPMVVTWAGGDIELSKEDLEIALFLLLRVSRSVRMLRFYQVRLLSVNLIKCTRLQDFHRLKELVIDQCFPHTLHDFGLATDFKSSLLDLNLATDLHFRVDFRPYVGEGYMHPYSKTGVTAGFGYVFKSVLFLARSHPSLLANNTLVRSWIVRQMIANSRYLNQNLVGLENVLARIGHAGYYCSDDLTDLVREHVLLYENSFDDEANYAKPFVCDRCSYRLPGACFAKNQRNQTQSNISNICGECVVQEELKQAIRKTMSEEDQDFLKFQEDASYRATRESVNKAVPPPVAEDDKTEPDLAHIEKIELVKMREYSVFNHRKLQQSRRLLTYAQSPTLLEVFIQMFGTDPSAKIDRLPRLAQQPAFVSTHWICLSPMSEERDETGALVLPTTGYHHASIHTRENTPMAIQIYFETQEADALSQTWLSVPTGFHLGDSEHSEDETGNDDADSFDLMGDAKTTSTFLVPGTTLVPTTEEPDHTISVLTAIFASDSDEADSIATELLVNATSVINAIEPAAAVPEPERQHIIPYASAVTAHPGRNHEDLEIVQLVEDEVDILAVLDALTPQQSLAVVPPPPDNQSSPVLAATIGSIAEANTSLNTSVPGSQSSEILEKDAGWLEERMAQMYFLPDALLGEIEGASDDGVTFW